MFSAKSKILGKWIWDHERPKSKKQRAGIATGNKQPIPSSRQEFSEGLVEKRRRSSVQKTTRWFDHQSSTVSGFVKQERPKSKKKWAGIATGNKKPIPSSGQEFSAESVEKRRRSSARKTTRWSDRNFARNRGFSISKMVNVENPTKEQDERSARFDSALHL